MQTPATGSYKLSESNSSSLAYFGLLMSTTSTFPDAADISIILPLEALSGCLQAQSMNLAPSKENLQRRKPTDTLGWGQPVSFAVRSPSQASPSYKPNISHPPQEPALLCPAEAAAQAEHRCFFCTNEQKTRGERNWLLNGRRVGKGPRRRATAAPTTAVPRQRPAATQLRAKQATSQVVMKRLVGILLFFF